MKFVITNKTRKTAAFILLGLICSLIINNTTYLHSHLRADGTIVQHAHPYNKSADKTPFKTHKHSKYEYSRIASVQLFTIATVLIIPVLNASKVFFYIQKETKEFSYTTNFCPLRAPPCKI